MFVTFEGVDGCGKTTQARLLAERLRAEGRGVVETREPGGTELGERIRALLLEAAHPIVPWAEAALFAAARAQLVADVIRPALAAGRDVVCDRYLDSSLAYQGIARGLGVEPVLDLNLAVTGGLLPDRTVLLAVEPAEALRRRTGEADRIEGEGEAFLSAVAAAYRSVAERFPGRIVVADGSRDPQNLSEEIRGRLRDLP